MMTARIIHQHIEPPLIAVNLLNRFAPAFRLRHIQFDHSGLRNELCRQRLRFFAPLAYTQVDEVGRRFSDELSGNSLPQSSIRPRNKNDPPDAHAEKCAPMTCWLHPATLTSSVPPP